MEEGGMKEGGMEDGGMEDGEGKMEEWKMEEWKRTTKENGNIGDGFQLLTSHFSLLTSFT
jgi:hypothetical protein